MVTDIGAFQWNTVVVCLLNRPISYASVVLNIFTFSTTLNDKFTVKLLTVCHVIYVFEGSTDLKTFTD